MNDQPITIFYGTEVFHLGMTLGFGAAVGCGAAIALGTLGSLLFEKASKALKPYF